MKAAFGSIDDEYLRMSTRSSLLGASAREEIPLRHITSVRTGTKYTGAGVMLVIIGILLLYIAEGGLGNGFGAIAIVVGAFLAAGVPYLAVSVPGAGDRVFVAWPWQRRAVMAFAAEIRNQISGLTKTRSERQIQSDPSDRGGDTSAASELERLAEMYAEGVLTEDEFAAAKRRLLGLG